MFLPSSGPIFLVYLNPGFIFHYFNTSYVYYLSQHGQKTSKKADSLDENWLTDQEIGEWIAVVKGDDTKYRCKVCRKTNDLSNMGRTALSDHQLGKTHIENVKKIRNFFPTASPAVDTHQSSKPGSSQQTIDGAVTCASVVNAEIRWALKCVMAGYSNNSNRPMSDLFPVMFPASPTAAKYQLGPDKLRHSINFGLGPFFKGKLMHDVQNSNYYSLISMNH